MTLVNLFPQKKLFPVVQLAAVHRIVKPKRSGTLLVDAPAESSLRVFADIGHFGPLFFLLLLSH
jgi:hypothetical protein